METPQQITEKLYIKSLKAYFSDRTDKYYYNEANTIALVLRVAFSLSGDDIKKLDQQAAAAK
jgi:hypothetical protein